MRDKAGREAVVVVRGLERYVTDEDGPGAAAIIRPRAEDLFPSGKPCAPRNARSAGWRHLRR